MPGPSTAPSWRSCLLLALLLAAPPAALLGAPGAVADGAAPLPPLPAARMEAAAVEAGGKIYLFGGEPCPGCAPTDEILVHDPATGNVTVVGHLPSGRSGAAAIERYPHVYVFGGEANATPLSDVVRFDAETGEVRTMNATMPGGRYWAAAAHDGMGIRVLGGADASGILDSTLFYDPGNDTFVEDNVTLPGPLARMAVAQAYGATYLLGGYNETGVTDVILVHEGNGTFREAGARLPWPVAGASGAYGQQNAFVFGGDTPEGASGAILRYDPAQDRVVVMNATLPTPRNATAAAYAWSGGHDDFYVYGGMNATGVALDEIVRYHTTPGAPPALAATATAGGIRLDWVEPNESTWADLVGYRIFRGSEPGSHTHLAWSPGRNTSFLDANVEPGTWYYVVLAYSNAYEGPLSPEANATFIRAPGAPQNVTAEAANASSVRVAWDPPLDAGGSPVTQYHVWRRNDTSEAARVATVPASQTSWLDEPLPPNATYHYSVSAENAAGEGPRSKEATATTPPEAAPPSAPRDLAAAGGVRAVNLSWSPPESDGGSPVTGYRVYRNDLLVADLSASDLSHQDAGLANGTTYHYTVRAVNLLGEGDAAQASATTHDVPTQPRNLTATKILLGGIRLDWEAPERDGGSPVTGYRIHRSLSPTSNGAIIDEVGDVRTYTDAGCPLGSTCYYRVDAVNAVGPGPVSNQAGALG